MVGSISRRIRRLFFNHLYHGLAWSYDFVAAVVSLGHWNRWIEAAIPFLAGPRVLELGHGPGHLQTHLSLNETIVAFGLDESPQMGRLAKHRIAGGGTSAARLVRGQTQRLPFLTGALDTIVATFPAEFISEMATIAEAKRVLSPTGNLVILPAAWLTGRQPLDRAALWLFDVTQQTPTNRTDFIARQLGQPLRRAGFHVNLHEVAIESSIVLILVASRQTGINDEHGAWAE